MTEKMKGLKRPRDSMRTLSQDSSGLEVIPQRTLVRFGHFVLRIILPAELGSVSSHQTMACGSAQGWSQW